jgi:hypothetical protein
MKPTFFLRDHVFLADTLRGAAAPSHVVHAMASALEGTHPEYDRVAFVQRASIPEDLDALEDLEIESIARRNAELMA